MISNTCFKDPYTLTVFPMNIFKYSPDSRVNFPWKYPKISGHVDYWWNVNTQSFIYSNLTILKEVHNVFLNGFSMFSWRNTFLKVLAVILHDSLSGPKERLGYNTSLFLLFPRLIVSDTVVDILLENVGCTAVDPHLEG